MSLLLTAAVFIVPPREAFIVPLEEAFTCTPVRVWDGDGPLWCAEGPRIRLSGIATRKIEGHCRDRQPCPI